MYQQFFGLSEPPFSIAVNPRYLFMSARHRDALAHLLYGVGSGGGFILLTGEVGTGKTTLNRCLLEQLPEATDIAIILNPALSAVELLAAVCDELEIAYPEGTTSLKVLTDALHRFLLANHQRDRRTVLMIDEAQHLAFDVLEQIRLLTNLETDDRKLLQIILTGQPELAAMLSRPELRQLNQRITARYNLTPLDVHETGTYIRHRLEVAGLGAGTELFPEASLRQVFRLTGGVPRLINLVCDRALMGAYGRNESTVSAALVKRAAVEALGIPPSDQQRANPGAARADSGGAPRWLVWTAAGIVTAVFALWMLAQQTGWLFLGDDAVSQSRSALQISGSAAETSEDSGPLGLVDRATALAALWMLWSDSMPPRTICPGALDSPLRCEVAEASVWDEVLEINRPAALDLRDQRGFTASTVLLGDRNGQALVWSGAGLCEVSWQALGERWLGSYRYLWQPPDDWAGPLALGDSGAGVRELVRLLASLDGLSAPPLDTFTEPVEARVKAFQLAAGLEVDGVAGLKTLLKIQDQLGESLSVATALRRASDLAEGQTCP